MSSPPKTINWKQILPGLLISIVALGIVLYLANPRQLWEALKLADYRLVLIGLGFMLAWLVVRTIYWRTLLQEAAPFRQVFFAINEGYLLNNVLPFRLGEIGRALILSFKASLNFMFVFSTILIERAVDVGISAGLLLISVPFVVGGDWAGEAALVSVTLVVAGLLLLYQAARYRERLLQWFDRLRSRFVVLQKISAQHLDAFFTGLEALTDGRRFLRAIFWALLNWTIAVVQYFIIMRAFIPNAEPLWAVFALGAAALGVAAPSSPGAVGVYELAVVGAMSLFGIDPAIGLAYALTAHLIQYLTTVILGTIGLFRDGLSLGSIFQRAQSLPLENS